MGEGYPLNPPVFSAKSDERASPSNTIWLIFSTKRRGWGNFLPKESNRIEETKSSKVKEVKKQKGKGTKRTKILLQFSRLLQSKFAAGPDPDPAQWQEWGKWSKCSNCKPGQPRSGVTARSRRCGCTFDQVLSCLSYDGLFRKVSIVNNDVISSQI